MISTPNIPPRARRCVAALLFVCAGLISGFAQTFVAEWNASTQGGVGPTGLVLATEGGTGFLYASDQPRGRVLKFNTATGVVTAVFGKQGDAPGDFNSPYGLARDPASGDIYVAERGNNRISRITNSGTFVMSWGSAGSGAGQFNEPIGVAVDTAGEVYVTDHANHRVQKFHVAQSGGSWSATHLLSWGAQGSGNGQFNLPYGVTADAAGNIWVADGFNGRVQRFNTSGVYQSTLGSAGTAAGQFVVATWVGLHPGGDLLVTSTNSNPQDGTLADAPNQWVSRFTSTGTFVSRFGGAYGSGNGQFRLPFSAVVDSANRAYVSDYYNTRIQVFDLGTTPPAGGSGGTTGGSTGGMGGGTGGGGTSTGGTGGGGSAGGGTTTPAGVHVLSTTVPTNRTYGKGDELSFTVKFSSRVSIAGTGRDDDRDRDGDDEEDAPVYFSWSGVAIQGQVADSGRVAYRSGSGTDTLTFRYKVKNGDVAAAGIRLGTTLELARGVTLRDSTGATLTTAQLALPWPQNPLAGVILRAPKPNEDKDGNGNGNANGNGHGRAERLVNLSSRLRVTGGDATRSVVAGFVVTGAAPKPILIRAVGPGLRGFGIRDALDQPRLVLRDSTGKIVAENEGWNDRIDITIAGDRVGAFRLGAGSRDSALIAALPPGSYTAQVTANGNGIVLVEVYDASTGTQLDTEQIVNISTRGFVGTDDDVLVAGFVVTGAEPKKVLIRGVGPALGAFGVTGTLADPVLKLYAANSTSPLAQNDNWQTPLTADASQTPATATEIAAAATAVGAFPLPTGGKDAAIVVSLRPGNYSAVVSGVNRTTGAGLVEIYELP